MRRVGCHGLKKNWVNFDINRGKYYLHGIRKKQECKPNPEPSKTGYHFTKNY